LKTPYLLGIITALLFGSFALSGMMAQGGPQPIETLQVVGDTVTVTTLNSPDISSAECPISHPFLIGGDYGFVSLDSSPGQYDVSPRFITNTNSYGVAANVFSGNGIQIQAIALCSTFNFPLGMSMVGGIPLDIDTLSLFVGAIGVNPVITGLVAITMGGVAAQAIWYYNSRRAKSENSN